MLTLPAHLLLTLPLLPLLTHAALEHRPPSAQPQDPFASPKFQVSFLNHHPISQSEAKAWQRDAEGMWDRKGTGEVKGDLGLLFMGDEVALRPAEKGVGEEQKMLDDGKEGEHLPAVQEEPPVYYTPTFIPLKLPGPNDSDEVKDYLCMVPHPLSTKPVEEPLKTEEEEEEVIPDPLIGWQSLKHLEGSCLYSKQGWFTYSYCHNSHVRQFREAPHVHPHPPGGHIPKEDLSYEAYNLGLSPALVAKQSNTPAKTPPSSDPQVSLSQNAHNRYLVQRWGSGTPCDKTTVARTVEIQFHCRMGGVDSIGFIKEVSTCKYVLVIYTPNLCSLPGFSAPTPHDTPSHPIKCRHIVPDGSIVSLQRSLDNELRHRERRLRKLGDEASDREVSEKDSLAVMVREKKVQGDRYPKGWFPTQAFYKAPPPPQEYKGVKGALELPKELEGLLGGGLEELLGGKIEDLLGQQLAGGEEDPMIFSLGNMDEIEDLGEMEVEVDGRVVMVKTLKMKQPLVESGKGKGKGRGKMTLDEEIAALTKQLEEKQKERDVQRQVDGADGQEEKDN